MEKRTEPVPRLTYRTSTRAELLQWILRNEAHRKADNKLRQPRRVAKP